MGVHERSDSEPRSIAGGSYQIAEQLNNLLRKYAVSDSATVGLLGAMGFTADPPREAE
jgi:hypothetical protein